MRICQRNWMQVEAGLRQEDRAVVPLGSTEQHGYLSLLSDVKIPLALADSASKQTGIPLAPPLNFGASPYFLSYPGTLSLRVSTLLELAEDLVRSAFSQGFHRILVLNGHGGNDPVRTRLYEIANQLPQLHLAWYAWWQSHSVEAIAQAHGLRSYHAGWIEAFPFTRVADLPAGEKIPPRIPGLMESVQARQLYGDGVFGGPYQVADSIMDEVFAAALQDVFQLLRFE